MDSIVSVNLFENTKDNYERCDLTSLLFKDIDYSKDRRSVSFYRSDFNRSQFNSCTFYKNIFGRADFINIFAVNTEFLEVDFGSCMIKNATFEKTQFEKNRYHGVAIQNSYFYKSTFRNETFVTNMFETTFDQCTLINCKFEKSSLDHITFINCEFIKVDIAECWAENLRFDNCTLRDVYLGASLWTTYLYKATDIDNFSFKYRGEIIDLWNGTPEDFLAKLWKQGRLFEYLNAIIVGRKILQRQFIVELQKALGAMKLQPIQIRKNNITRTLEMILFYSNSDAINFLSYMETLETFEAFPWSDLPFEEEILYDSIVYKIQKNFQNFNFSISYLLALPRDEICVATYHLNFDTSDIARLYLEQIYQTANIECGNTYQPPYMQIISERTGSIIMTVASIATLTLLISFVAKKVFHNLSSIRIESKVTKEISKQIEDSGGDIKKLKNACSVADKYNLLDSESDSKTLEKLSSEVTKGEILDIVLQFLT